MGKEQDVSWDRDGDMRSRRSEAVESNEEESFYSTEKDDTLRVDRRQTPRPQAYWGSGHDLEPRFADHVQLSRVESHYHLTFGQSHVPITTDSGTAPVNEIRPIVRVIIPKEVVRRMMTLIEMRQQEEGGGDW